MQTDLFLPAIDVQFREDELERLRRPWSSDWGAVKFLEELVTRINLHGEAAYTQAELEQAYHFGYEGKQSGGPQGRFKIICQAAFRAGWTGTR